MKRQRNVEAVNLAVLLQGSLRFQSVAGRMGQARREAATWNYVARLFAQLGCRSWVPQP